MKKRSAIAFGAIALVAALVCAAGFAIEPQSRIETLDASSPCPVTGCASGVCHGFADVPEPDGVHELVCPEAGCASVECHAQDTLSTRYHQASDASLTLWIFVPAVIVVALVFVVRRVG